MGKTRTRTLLTPKTLGGRLREAREAKKLTQEQLGEVLGVSKSQISYYESDKDAPPYHTLEKAAKTLRRTLNFLVTGTEGVGGEMIDPDTYRLIVKIKDFPEVLRDYVEWAISIAERTKGHLPPNVTTPPTSDAWIEFHAYLQRLSDTLPKDPPSPKDHK